MIKIDQNYTDYRDDTDPKYPGGKAVNATTPESTDGTPFLADWMNDVDGALQAIFIEAFGDINEVSGNPDNAKESDVLKAIKKITQDYTDKVNKSESQLREQSDSAIKRLFDQHIGNDKNPHGVNKWQIGLGNVDNTSDNQKSVGHARRADHALNADAIGGYKIKENSSYIENGIIPVYRFRSENDCGYLCLRNGFALQWDSIMWEGVRDVESHTFYFPLSFENAYCSVFLGIEALGEYSFLITEKTGRTFTVKGFGTKDLGNRVVLSYIAVGKVGIV